MLNGAILPREQWFDEKHWSEDILNKCFFDDSLQGYTIQITRELHIHDLMRMGTIDWHHKNSCRKQSTQAMQLATALASQIIWIANTNQAKVSTCTRGGLS